MEAQLSLHFSATDPLDTGPLRYEHTELQRGNTQPPDGRIECPREIPPGVVRTYVGRFLFDLPVGSMFLRNVVRDHDVQLTTDLLLVSREERYRDFQPCNPTPRSW